jgi:hypothetical protein
VRWRRQREQDRPRQDDGRLGRFERGLFAFMGPPELGDLSAPPAQLPARPVERCPRCGLPRDEHEVVRTPHLTYTRCSADDAGR